MQRKNGVFWVLSLALLTACATDRPRETALSTTAVDRDAGAWRPWVLSSGRQMRLPLPPDAAVTATELQQLRTLIAQRDAANQERIRRRESWSPSHRCNEMLIDISAANPPRPALAFGRSRC